MQADIVKIGNSRGIRLPATILKQCGIGSKVELEIKDNKIILKPVKTPRQGWAAAFKRMNQNDDDILLIPDDVDADLLEEWNEN
ncbi:MAG TPA: AbrB/MazE/SpoVT family DNA-binding domain-containing protein [Methylomusa anaerophila]|uniref:SpoVT / AbrB like domain protein n=1 Tax=Methylomusa anaerophila TaxID=1930071 RepID=A0A348AKK5_9FIRM|nr:AbrB/MazE/SpoVT family DNA-binding domain-containing protein [Methylomusa anaerophila]BBB91603.1 SpoVT / AbrB like domain protein [Methylomusa anaerophila]HML89459.1 AbrB/MazE/SpoVT family DNA-binding domain-containing protein [Methylomusa anaerophila]